MRQLLYYLLFNGDEKFPDFDAVLFCFACYLLRNPLKIFTTNKKRYLGRSVFVHGCEQSLEIRRSGEQRPTFTNLAEIRFRDVVCKVIRL